MTAYIRTRPNMDLVQFVPPPVCAVFVVSMDRDFVKEIGEFEVSNLKNPKFFLAPPARGGAAPQPSRPARPRLVKTLSSRRWPGR